jgi:CRP-like cAMP-binding protein
VARRADQPVAASVDPALLANHFLFRDLGADIHERLRAYARLRSFKRGDVVFSKGDPGNALFAVCAGVVQMTSLSTAGKNAVFSLIKQGEIFGEIALLDGKPRTTDAVAFTDCTLMMIERRDFMPLLRSHPEVAINLLEVLCAKLRRTTEQVEDLLFLDLRSRLVKTLLRMSQPTKASQVIAISQADLSNIVGMSREMINKQLQIWAKVGWIRLERRLITVLRPEELAQIIAED